MGARVMSGKVLLLEDDADQLELLAMALADVRGFEVVPARSVQDLQQRAEPALGCSIALLDVNLGHGQPSGLDAYRWLRQQKFRGRVYFLTGHARSHPMVAQAMALGDAQLIEKPISIERLSTLLEGDAR